mmetsp:Transcript_37550/g.106037  ORF Transcript_37550/g.106037 Transcript_37550/m.106037 type:complete len:403 (+) Transcript_37550:107-1315(+)|eukprot:CAMPEP_0117678482 /NCGR_PEP_ID=MMETSP0804-20121206/17322_1 /TAXON_ID=1074897 /ORGANISM="Tetraselmis astigmatica, Strain CCMP880" /LENGTH=402 /DNA_ID=CAMNT_0005487875 /DNA_START=54 /DNA_END=1262 /DNA_ORIENTATION=-
MKVLVCVSLCLLLVLQGLGGGAALLDVVQAVRGRVASILKEEPKLGPKMVRLSFHDCVGGCDGCIDLEDGNNWGLEMPISALDPIAKDFASHISRADVWAIAGITANQVLQKDTHLEFTFDKWGRLDCGPSATGTPQPQRELPSPNLDTQDVLDYFKAVFGHTPEETVAIMGAHTLGYAARNQSGFDGAGGWDSHPLILDNKYYGNLMKHPWRQVFIDNRDLKTPDRYMWRLADASAGLGPAAGGETIAASSRRHLRHLLSRGQPSAPHRQAEGPMDQTPLLRDAPTPKDQQFMFNTDIALAKDFSQYLDLESGRVTCDMVVANDVCPVSSTAKQAMVYANDIDAFLTDYEAAFKKMIYAVPEGNPPLSDMQQQQLLERPDERHCQPACQAENNPSASYSLS